jgi:hypothetical protein
MNWGVRITIILLIVAGLLWLNWDRFVAGTPEQESSESIETAPVNALPDNAGEETVTQHEPADTLQQPDSSESLSGYPDTVAPQTPQFDLQAAPETLDQSDDAALFVAAELSPEVGSWLTTEQEQIRKWTLLVKQAAEGKTLYQDRPFVLPMAPFKVEEKAGRYFISPENFKRYDGLVSALEHLPAEKTVAYYRAWSTLFEEAFSELGLAGDFEEQVRAMLDRVLKVSLIDRPIELKEPTSVNYKFMDPALEKASQIEKWLWRMGPDNARKIQDLAARLKRALDESSQIR